MKRPFYEPDAVVHSSIDAKANRLSMHAGDFHRVFAPSLTLPAFDARFPARGCCKPWLLHESVGGSMIGQALVHS